MTKRLTIFAVLLITGLTAFAQTYDEVSVGSQYSQQAYYTLSTGAVKAVNNDAWDIAFSNVGQIDAGIFINESASLTGTPVNLFLAPTTDWSAAITDVTGFVDDARIYNAELNWSEGAFNEVKDPNNPLDYGWGAYNVQNHQIVGDKVFVVQKRNGSFIKLKIDALKSGYYHFRYANLDGTNEVIDSVAKATNGANSIVHYSFETKQIVSIANDYDLVFTRYFTPLDAGGGEIIEYAVTGILLAPGTEAVVADGVDVTTVKEEDYAADYTALPTILGHDWKVFDFTAGWILDEDRANFVKTKSGEKYKLVFVDFTGSGTGTTTIEKTKLETASTSVQPERKQISFYPNPVKEALYISTPTQEDVEVSIFNSLGQRILYRKTGTNRSISLPSNVSAGTYHALVQGTNWKTSHSFIVVN